MRKAIKLIIKQDIIKERDARNLMESCPFAALEYSAGRLSINSDCRLCGLCVKSDTGGALDMLYADEGRLGGAQAGGGGYDGIAVFAETDGDRVAPVSLELLGKALELSRGAPVKVAAIGYGLDGTAQKLGRYGAASAHIYDSPELEYFEACRYGACLCDFIVRARPSALLVGATDLGRSVAPRVAAAFGTGLTADCTGLDFENGLLIQTRPAFGGNIMARIITRDRRPQICTVRYRVFDAPPERDSECEITRLTFSDATRATSAAVSSAAYKNAEVLSAGKRPPAEDISEAERIVAVGRGARDEKGLALCRELAGLLGAQLACSRPMAEDGFFEQRRQIGLSGRMVKPKLLIIAGVSGAVQFATAMRGAEHIIAVNTDKNAPIFNVAHQGLVGSVHEIFPRVIGDLRNRRNDGAQNTLAR